ncbi:ParB/RepB/Spo0J family partition protein [Aliiruegeria sabulilitoris]|uniref:ParB/RepB/Spo0J family partition protein n=1 Tax=Aliiruegeria sabulilitoris TaxID=1510458 RepID=UPI00082BFF1B|nr:ParB/RepB/Spo0J family partition protein [Aliiruegeria sabulilitoris]NDR57528.1 ParB/RepB/Spo0J family partition protein [Pseudoruegeria sp. M32A2M]
MEKKNRKTRGLGRGLSALMADVSLESADATDATPAAAERTLPIECLVANPDQPRKDFSPTALQELCDSIREKGIIQPLIVRENPRDKSQYEIVAGERRWRAAQMAQIHDIPVVIREFDDTEVLEIAIIENVQRADLNAIEEGLGYRQLIERFGHTQEKLAQALGKSRSHIANIMRLLQLPDEVQGMLREGKISAGHARAIITSDEPSALARKVISKGLSVRETEALVKKPDTVRQPKTLSKRQTPEKDADTRALESDLSANLRMKVSIDHLDIDGSGQMVIRYRSLDQLDALCQLLSTSPLDESI